MELPAAIVEASERKELVSVGERRHSRYAGDLMLFASLMKLDLYGILESLGHRLGRRYGWGGSKRCRPLFSASPYVFARSRIRRNALSEDQRVILGERRSPSVQSLRKKVCLPYACECGPCDAVTRAVSQLCEIASRSGKGCIT